MVNCSQINTPPHWKMLSSSRENWRSGRGSLEKFPCQSMVSMLSLCNICSALALFNPWLSHPRWDYHHRSLWMHIYVSILVSKHEAGFTIYNDISYTLLEICNKSVILRLMWTRKKLLLHANMTGSITVMVRLHEWESISIWATLPKRVSMLSMCRTR